LGFESSIKKGITEAIAKVSKIASPSIKSKIIIALRFSHGFKNPITFVKNSII
jgi:hypothetical protein